MPIELAKTTKLGVVILAAGKGTRMNNPDMAKVMYEVNKKPMIQYVVELAKTLQANRTLLIVGWQRDSVINHFVNHQPPLEFVDQKEQLGTGHALMQTEDALKDFEGDLLVLSGDVPLLTEQTVKALIGYHRTSSAVATILTAELDDPTGYGRIIRNADESVNKIVEHKDASKKESAIKEINSGIYIFDKQKVFESLKHITPNNAQGEFYLTDVFEFFWKNKLRVSAVKAIDPVEVMGINNLTQLEEARNVIQKRLQI
jgi:UDP-N-acetylglucosamine pyrophosphorylase